MTVTPDSGYVDYSRENIPRFQLNEESSGGARRLGPSSGVELYPHKYTAKSRPSVVNANIWGKNGYYMNGPYVDPFDHAVTVNNQIQSYTQSFTDPARKAMVQDFALLLNKYGSTNSPGTLWSMAQAGLTSSNPVAQEILKVDAKASQEDYARSAPVRAASPAANNDDGWLDNMWQPAEFLARNAFAALSMPLEAVQGTIRGIGAELTQEEGADFGGAFAQLGSLVFPPIALWGNAVRGDSEFNNPWEQTNFGQTLLAMSAGEGFDAFTSAQAGLDVNRAREELLLDPQYAQLQGSVEGEAQLDVLATNLAQENNYYSEPGWFIDETSRIGEATKRQAFDTWAIPGPDGEMQVWTLGRGITSAVAGPDWVGYSVASGIIDATASIFLDPTIIGAKFGAVSKTVKGLSTLTRGEEGAILVGKEAAKQRAAVGTANRALLKAAESQDINPADLARMSLEEQSSVVRDHIISNMTTETLAGTSVDLNYLAGQARELRRNMATNIKSESILQDAIPVTAADNRAVTLWNEYITEVYDVDRNFNPERWYEFRSRVGQNSEDVAIWERISRQEADMQLRGELPENDYESSVQFLNTLNNVTKGDIKRPKGVDPTKVEQDTARIFSDELIEPDLDFIRNPDVVGATLLTAPTKGQPVISTVDGVDTVSYWMGRSEPKLVNANDVIPPRTRKAIVKELDRILDSEEMRTLRLDVAEDSVDSIAGQVANQINGSLNPKQALQELVSLPDLNYGRLVMFARETGLDKVLDDVLRAKAKADGVIGSIPETAPTGLRNYTLAAFNGVWMGDNPNLVAYAVSQTGRQAGVGLRGADEIETALAGLVGADQIPVGMRSLSIEDLMNTRRAAQDNIGRQVNDLRSVEEDYLFNAQAKDVALNSRIEEVRRQFEDPKTALRKTIGYNIGMRNTATGGMTLDEEGVRKFLFGVGPTSSLGNRALDALSDFISESDRAKIADLGMDSEFAAGILEKSMGSLHVITNGRWDPETIRAVAENAMQGGGRSGLIDVLAPRLGVDVTKGSVSRTTKAISTDGKSTFRTWRQPNPVIARALGQMPTSRKVNLSNADEVSDAILLWGRYAKVDEDVLATNIGKVLAANGSPESVGVNRNMLLNTFNQISDSLLDRIEDSKTGTLFYKGKKGLERKTQIMNAIRSSTLLYVGGETKELSENIAMYGTNSAVAKIITADAKQIDLPNITLDTELAQGFIGLPSVDEWSAALNRFTLALERFPITANTYDLAKRFFDNFYRTALLALRGAYIIRNTAEMQVRMFLNGHQSVLSDPLTMIGMTVGNIADAKRARKISVSREDIALDLEKTLGRAPTKKEIDAKAGGLRDLNKVFAPYSDTVLGSRFEVGLDEQLAVANDVEEYFQLIRMAHSLTDPRVYNSAVRQGWQPISYGTPKFNKGWAHELIMLERSGLARLVVAGPDPSYAYAVNARGGMSAEDLSVSWLLSSTPEAVNLRKLMIGADSKFKQIFDDPSAVRQFLFDNPNSVFNRIRQFTASDERLVDYIRTGIVKYGNNETLNLRTIVDPNKRIDSFSTVLQKHFNDDTWAQHFTENSVKVPWIENIDQRAGIGIFNKFFDVANKIERLGAVGPEFRMLYWDRIAELAPALRGADVNRALNAARTTLSPLKRMNPDGKLDNFGRNHPAFTALSKAKEENIDGLLTLDDLHAIASSYAAEGVRELFYDAARRNNFWNALRILFPFGQAWGNTLETWGRLGQKAPIQVYKAQKALNAMIESGSSAVYEFGQEVGAYGQYAPGFAPWEQDSNGGFFYTDKYGDTSFMYPFVGRMAALPLNAWSLMVGNGPTGVSEIPMQSPASSLNLAVGADSIFPGVGMLGALPLGTGVLPDNEITASLRQIAMPFGESTVTQSMVPSWFAKVLGGVGAVPVVGEALDGWLSVLAPQNKNKNLRDAMMILSSSGNYPDWATNPETARLLRDDAAGLGKALLLTTGLFQNVLPSTPYVQPVARLDLDQLQGDKEGENTALYTIGMLNSTFQQYRSRNGFDDSMAREEFVKDFGPAALFATTGDWKNLSRVPTSDALKFARQYPDIAKANLDQFTLFFPNGDSSDVAATMWIRKYGKGDRERKTKDEIFEEVISFLERTQRFRIDSLEANKIINSEEAEFARDEIKQRYLETGVTSGVYVDKTDEMNKLFAFVNRYPQIQETTAGAGFMEAWTTREYALSEARRLTGRDDATLGGEKVSNILDWYISKIDEIESRNPDFMLLAGKFRREWD
jgi:hypothetical protein